MTRTELDPRELPDVRASREFVVDVVSRDPAGAVNLPATDFPRGEDAFAWAGPDAAPSAVPAPPRVAAARAALECRLLVELPIGTGTMVVGEVVHVGGAAGVLQDGLIAPERLDAVGRLGRAAHAGTGDPFRLDRVSRRGVSHTAGED